MINMLKSPMGKIDCIQDQIGNFSKEIETVRINQTERSELQPKYSM